MLIDSHSQVVGTDVLDRWSKAGMAPNNKLSYQLVIGSCHRLGFLNLLKQQRDGAEV